MPPFVATCSPAWRDEAPRFYEALGYEDLSGRQARYSRDL